VGVYGEFAGEEHVEVGVDRVVVESDERVVASNTVYVLVADSYCKLL
jgi:enhancing lycopene biosynthesis protein 2